MTFTFTSLPLNFYNSVSRCGCGFGFEQKYCRIDGFGGEKARIGGFVHPCLPPLEEGRVHVIAITKHGCINYRIIASTKKIVLVRMLETTLH